jgi:membrane protease subunit HflK
MEQVLSKVDKTIVETGGVTPYLPIPEFKGRPAPKAEPVTVTGKRQ